MSVVDIAMPRLSDSMEEATVVRWLKQPGDSVSKGDELVEVETDKATIVYEAERDGVLEEIVTAEGRRLWRLWSRSTSVRESGPHSMRSSHATSA